MYNTHAQGLTLRVCVLLYTNTKRKEGNSMQDIINTVLQYKSERYAVLDLVNKIKSAQGDTLVVLVKQEGAGTLHTAELTGYGDTLAIERLSNDVELYHLR